jgi:hypothetical protein
MSKSNPRRRPKSLSQHKRSKLQVTKSPMPLPELKRRLRNQTLHRYLSKRKIILKNLPNARNTTSKVTAGIMNFRTRFAKKNAQININKLRDREQINLNFFTSASSFKVKWLFTLMTLAPNILPFLSSPKVTYSLCERGVRPEYHFLSLVMCIEQLESINHLFSMSLSITYIE